MQALRDQNYIISNHLNGEVKTQRAEVRGYANSIRADDEKAVGAKNKIDTLKAARHRIAEALRMLRDEYAEQNAEGGEKVVAQKLQHLLALLLKAEWPVGWPTFVPDLLGAAQVGDEARLRILLLLGEEAFAHGTPERAAAVRSTLGAQCAPVLSLCVRELQAPAGPERLRLALELLARHAAWLPPTALLLPEIPVLALLPQLLGQRAARPAALRLLAELSGLPTAAAAAAADSPAHDASWLALHANPNPTPNSNPYP